MSNQSDAGKLLTTLAMLGGAGMTNTTPTTTAQATVLSEEQLDYLIQRFQHLANTTNYLVRGMDEDTSHGYRSDCIGQHGLNLIASHRALTEQVRVLRECVEWYADEDNQDSFGCFWDDLTRDNGNRARRALAALEGQPQ